MKAKTLNALKRIVRAQLRDLASRESKMSAYLVNNKAAKLPLSHKSRVWNVAFQQGIYEGVRRCEDLLRQESDCGETNQHQNQNL